MEVSQRGDRQMVHAVLCTVKHLMEMTTRPQNIWVRHSDLSSIYHLNANRQQLKSQDLLRSFKKMNKWEDA